MSRLVVTLLQLLAAISIVAAVVLPAFVRFGPDRPEWILVLVPAAVALIFLVIRAVTRAIWPRRA